MACAPAVTGKADAYAIPPAPPPPPLSNEDAPPPPTTKSSISAVPEVTVKFLSGAGVSVV